MDVIYPRCAGLDVHKQTVVACARLSGDGAAKQEVRTFATTTSGLLALADWLESLGVQHVAMEATGVYWKPVWHVLEGHFVLVLANAGLFAGAMWAGLTGAEVARIANIVFVLVCLGLGYALLARFRINLIRLSRMEPPRRV